MIVAFVSPNHVIQLIDDLPQLIRNAFGQDAYDILDYFEDNCFGKFRPKAPSREPLFYMEIWIMFNHTDEELPRSNNAVEGWHRGFQANAAACHPTFWKFIGLLKNEESLIRTVILQNQGGHQPPPQRRP